MCTNKQIFVCFNLKKAIAIKWSQITVILLIKITLKNNSFLYSKMSSHFANMYHIEIRP